ncbi:hypothetical protein BCR36DRAFT_356488 [Piromyces finnis]|uniref:Myb-like domain-containing protein n=1 Tax=Piromyces finnis TaxID=1754191 RepID=A0A1Y1V4D8_9FUNG|nr:hypothetical protein BCR36DRAFT_356488 [Piromyces finnis]|eukprot:ORX46937.1 hypothetical protein BCR36DRAFT_356488 [Piromyces finnis]
MNKLIVTSLRVNKNQRKFAPSLKKAKKSKNKKVDKDQKKNVSNQATSSNNDDNTSINNNRDKNINDNSVKNKSLSINEIKDSNVNSKDSIVIKKLDTLKESRFFGISQQPKSNITPKKSSTSNTRLKLLAEVQDEQLNTNNTTINNTEETSKQLTSQVTNITSSQQDDTQTTITIPTTELVKDQSQLPSSEDTLIVTPIPITSLSESQLNASNDFSAVDEFNNHDTMESTSKDDINNTSIYQDQDDYIPSTPKNEVDVILSKDTTLPSTPAETNDSTKINTPQTISSPSKSPKSRSSDDTITPLKTYSNSTSISKLASTQDTILFNELEQKINNLKKNLKDPSESTISISDPASPSFNNLSTVSSDIETINTLKITCDQDLNVNHSLSQQQSSPTKKRKIDDTDNNKVDDKKSQIDVSSQSTNKHLAINIPTIQKKQIISDLENATFDLLNSKLNNIVTRTNALKKISKRIDNMHKRNNSDGNDDGSEMTSSTYTSEFDDTTYSVFESEAENASAIDDDIKNEQINIDNKNDDSYQESLKSKKRRRVKKSQLIGDDIDSPAFKTFKEFSEIEKAEEPISINKRTLADIIDSYHGKERSNIQKEKYKIAARKRKATLRRKRLAAEGITLAPEEEEPTIEIKKEIPSVKRPNENVAAVQMRVVNGEVVIDQSSLFINHIDTSNELPITEESRDQQVTSLSFKKNSNRSKKWKKDETDLFYQCISICGTDFGMMSVIMPTRNRKQLINKYHRETRLNPERIRKAFEKRKMIDTKNFNVILEKINQNKSIEVTNTEE